mgnify:CR=1 FL=1
MPAGVATSLFLPLNPMRLAGPIFDKELRVASRRRRLYALRFGYMVLLSVPVAVIWLSASRLGEAGPTVVRIARLAEAGKYMTVSIVWFQFLAAQVLATVLLSDALSGEVRHRTIDTLLVTPIRSPQIVLGKLLSGLVIIVLLLAISLPLLAIVRLLGGVSWEFVVAGVSITGTAALFAGSLSLLSSTSCRYAYQSVLAVGLWYAVVWGLLAFLLTSLARAGHVSRATADSTLVLTNPLVAMTTQTRAMLWASSPGSLPAWWLHCLVVMAVAALVLLLATWRLRGIAFGRRGMPQRAVLALRPKPEAGPRSRSADRPLAGSPIVWKELRRPLLQPWKRNAGIGVLLAGAAILVAAQRFGLLGPEAGGVFLAVSGLFQLLFTVHVAVSAAATVTREREARSLPILLTTPLEDREIVKGKAMGVFRRSLPLLAPVPLLYLLAVLSTPESRQVVLPAAFAAGFALINLIGSVVFLLGVGLYLSTRMRTTTTAVAATLAAYFAPRFFCCGPLPMTFLTPLMLGPGGGGLGMAVMLAGTMVPTAIYVGVGLLFLGAAIGRIRNEGLL